MQIGTLDVWDDDALAAWHAAYLTADTFGREHATPWTLKELSVDFRGERTGEELCAYSGLVDEEVVAGGVLILPLKDNRELGIVRLWTRPDSRPPLNHLNSTPS